MRTQDDPIDLKDTKSFLRSLEKKFDGVSLGDDAKDLLLRQCASESWFSDALAWLLDPKGSHRLGKSFADAFVRRVAEIRSASDGHDYAQGKGYLKARKHYCGRGAGQFNLGNAAVIREFFIADLSNASRRTRGYCDVVLLDLDAKDGIILLIENKLFTTNSKDQLSDYHEAVEERYGDVRTREFVYLTLFGTDPVGDGGDAATRDPEWARLSWCDDLLPILRQCAVKKPACADLVRLVKVLEWIQGTKNGEEDREPLREMLLHAGATCILGALQDRCGRGRWEFKPNGNQRTTTRTLCQTGNWKRRLHVRLLPNLTVVVAGVLDKKQLGPKVIIPFGAHPRQVKNLIALAADAIYNSYFRDSKRYYHPSAGSSPGGLDALWNDVEPVFDFTHRFAAPIQVLMAALAGWSADPDDDERTAIDS